VTDTSPKLTVHPDRPVDPLLIEILQRVDAATRALGIAYFIGGALARDLILMHVFGQDTGRATRDVDLGICIEDWAELHKLRASLIQGGGFAEQPNVLHRLIYRPKEDAFGIPLDLLPFGGIESANATIAWPPGMDVVMNVAGFAEACQATLSVEVLAGFCVPVTSLPSLAVLKLIAWRDRHLETSKDATDFFLIARHYADAGNFDRLYETESALLQATDFDPELAGAMLLGKDAAAVCRSSTARIVADILAHPESTQRLNDQILRATLSAGDDASAARVERYLGAFQSGFKLHPTSE
jgi:predicted nucleotidyltransferase